MKQREEVFKKRMQDLCRMAWQRDIVTFSDFLDLQELHIVHSLKPEHPDVSIRCFGGYEMSERQITAFIPDALSYEWDYPLCCLQIGITDSRFAQMPGHRDYLGALMSLGIERRMLGDILTDETGAYVFCLTSMTDFICRELTGVRRCSVRARIWEGELPAVTRQFREISGTVASVRLDSVISTALQTSRSSMTGLITGGSVYVNGRQVTSNGYVLRDQDIVSVRGMGKFQFMGVLSATKKGRQRILINRYV